jgi:hypothetical protein
MSVQSAGADVILSTDFTNRTVSGATASNLNWTMLGVLNPGDMTAGFDLFDTANAQGHFAPNRNTDNEGPWSTTITLEATLGDITLENVVLDYQFFNNGGSFQSSNRITDWTVSVTGSSSGLLDSVMVLGTSSTTGIETVAFGSSLLLSSSETWDVTITADGTTQGNNTGLDALTFNGTVGAPPSSLEIIVDRATGLITMDNINGDPNSFASIDIDIDYYKIASAAGALDPTEGTGWYSLSDQDIDSLGGGAGQNWDEAGSSDANMLVEAFLLDSSEISIDETQGLGNAFAGTELADEDLVFEYGFDSGALETGVVTYVGAYVPTLDPGDFNDDGVVDGQDFLKWQRDDGSPASLLEWETNYGMVYPLAAVTAAVPEPSSLSLIALGLLGMGYRRLKQA